MISVPAGSSLCCRDQVPGLVPPQEFGQPQETIGQVLGPEALHGQGEADIAVQRASASVKTSWVIAGPAFAPAVTDKDSCVHYHR